MRVNIYSTTYCHACDMAKEFLKCKGVEYCEYNVDNDKDKALEMIEKSGQTGVPVIEINDNLIIGFARQRIENLILQYSL